MWNLKVALQLMVILGGWRYRRDCCAVPDPPMDHTPLLFLTADQAIIGSRSTSTQIDPDRRTCRTFQRATQICAHAETKFSPARAISGSPQPSAGLRGSPRIASVSFEFCCSAPPAFLTRQVSEIQQNVPGREKSECGKTRLKLFGAPGLAPWALMAKMESIVRHWMADCRLRV